MPTIEKRYARQGPRYRVRVRRKGLRPMSRTFPKFTEAHTWGVVTESAALAGRDLPQDEAARHTVQDLLIRYRKQVLPRLAPGTQRNRTSHLTWWRTELGYLRLADVTPARLVECRVKLEKGRSPGTVNGYLSSLGHALSVAVRDWAWLDDNPMRRVRKLRLPPARARYLSDEERLRLLVACQQSSNALLHTIVVLALSTGARKQELLCLSWADVDLRRRELTFRMTKSRRPRVVPLAEHVVDLVRDHGRVRRLDTTLVFPRADGMKPADIRHAWSKALRTAKVADFTFHDLRHTFASYTAMTGASVLDLQALLGHSTPSMTSRYTHLAQPHLAQVVERMSTNIFH